MPVSRRVQVVAVLALLAYLVAGVGLLPSARQAAKWAGMIGVRTGLSGERFMCEDCSCGCVSAQECWTNCCCHSLAERLAWAKKNGVMVPREVMESAEAQALISRPVADEAEDSCPYCAAASERSCCTDRETETEAPSGLPSVSALGCKGVQAFLVVCAPLGAFGGVSVSLPRVEACGILVEIKQRAFTSRSLETDSPPPRRPIA